MQRIKDRRLKILQHLQRSQEGGVTDLAGASTRQVVKHRGSRNFRQHRAEDCIKHRPIPQNCGYRQLIRCPKPEENIRKIGKRRPIDGMAFRGTPPPINGPFSVVPRTRRRAPNQSRLFSLEKPRDLINRWIVSRHEELALTEPDAVDEHEAGSIDPCPEAEPPARLLPAPETPETKASGANKEL